MDKLQFSLEPFDALRFAKICGNLNSNLHLLKSRLNIEIFNRGNAFELTGDKQAILQAQSVIHDIYEQAKERDISLEDIHLHMQKSALKADKLSASIIKTRKMSIKPRGSNQQNYVKQIGKCAVNFGIGPAGTGKTYLAVACAVAALEHEEVKRILLVRPAVEAGEKLGFLPGDLAQKIDPYLRPLYDALYEMLGFDTVTKLIDKQIIEVAPLAYMRGRTLNHSFIILDESQNTTAAQMKMFLTRLGFGSTAVITGDITQVDLPNGTLSGLKHAKKILQNVDGISFTNFNAEDVVRHELVAKIIAAYDKSDS